jgi:hypothetical protein
MSLHRPTATEFRSTRTQDGGLKSLSPTLKSPPPTKKARITPRQVVEALLEREGASYAEYIDSLVITVPPDACANKSYKEMEEGCSVVPGVYWKIGTLASSKYSVYRQERLPELDPSPNSLELFLWYNQSDSVQGWYISTAPCDAPDVTHFGWIPQDPKSSYWLPVDNKLHVPYNAAKRIPGAECVSLHFYIERLNLLAKTGLAEGDVASNASDEEGEAGAISYSSSSNKDKDKGKGKGKGKDPHNFQKRGGGGWFNRALKLIVAFKRGDDAEILELTDEYASHKDMQWLVEKELAKDGA